ncbi:MAG: hypothetical protein EOO56_12250 [Hymenobacter sp.]|nr:MAG: hypothetical protein EOO56_12250 [Hymenobacter sp.]
MMRRASFLFCLAGGLACLVSGCGHALPTIPGFEAAAWRADPYGCHNQRAALLPPLLAARAQLYEARADDITALLGHPDEEELQAQTEKVYYYYLTPGAQCGARHPHAVGPRLSLHFGPLGTVTEVLADPLPAAGSPAAR